MLSALKFPADALQLLHPFPTFKNLTIDGTGTKFYASARAYQSAVSSILHKLNASQTGRAIFDEIVAKGSHKISIRPWEGKNLDATSIASSEKNAIPVGSSEGSGKGMIKGVGGGSDVVVSYTPGRFSNYVFTAALGRLSPWPRPLPTAAVRRPLPTAGDQPDDVMCHELLHCVRLMYGLWNPVPLADGYDNEEEFLAIMVANIYTSELGRKFDLRKNHQTNDHLAEDTDSTFLPKADPTDYRYRIVDTFIRTQPRLARKLAQVPSEFNPIRRHNLLQFSAFASVRRPWLLRI